MVLLNAEEKKNDIVLADTLVNLEPMPDHIPELVPFPSLTGPQLGSNEDIASNLIADCVLPLPPTPISSADGDCYQEIPSSKITKRVPRDGDVVEIKTNASNPKHRMTSILSEEESSDGWVENVVISQSMIETIDESKIKSKHVILQSEEESSEELVENVVLSQSMIRSSDKKKYYQNMVFLKIIITEYLVLKTKTNFQTKHVTNALKPWTVLVLVS